MRSDDSLTVHPQVRDEPERTHTISRLAIALLLAALVVAWFTGLDYRKLANPDEGRYAEIPREMVESGDWITPRLNGIKYFEKPPLQYWATALAYRAFGMSDWTARLWPALTGFLGILFAYFTGRRLFGARVGMFAAAVLASTFHYIAFAHIATLDMGATFFLSAGLFCFLLGMSCSIATREEGLWMLGAWAAMAAAVLSKGLIGILLPGIALTAYSIAQRDWSSWRRMRPVAGVLLFLVLCAPWFIKVSLMNPEFAWFFFAHEHFARFTGTAHHRDGPFWYFLPVLLIGMLPWTWLAMEGLRDAWRTRPPAGAFSPERFLLIWIAVIFLFFSVSSSKLPAYMLPLIPALALLIGLRMSRLSAMETLRRLIPAVILAGTALFVANELVEMIHESQSVFPLYEDYAGWIETAAVIQLATASCFALMQRLTRVRILLFALVMLFSVQLVVTGFESLSPLRSAYAMAGTIHSHLKPGTRVFSVGRYDQSLPPYLGQAVVLVAYTDELGFGLIHEPDRWLPSLAEFEREWKSVPNAIAIMTPEAYKSSVSHGLPLRVLSQSGDGIVVIKPD
jgi:4-amino-4-deoxy-L-arabinose transferase-like glycosyltransferase